MKTSTFSSLKFNSLSDIHLKVLGLNLVPSPRTSLSSHRSSQSYCWIPKGWFRVTWYSPNYCFMKKEKFSNWALSCILLKDARNQKSAFREWRVLYEHLHEFCEIWWSLICTSTVTSFKARHDEQPINLRKWGRLHALKSYYATDNENTLFEGSTIH